MTICTATSGSSTVMPIATMNTISTRTTPATTAPSRTPISMHTPRSCIPTRIIRICTTDTVTEGTEDPLSDTMPARDGGHSLETLSAQE
jgi:hypothetical protein